MAQLQLDLQSKLSWCMQIFRVNASCMFFNLWGSLFCLFQESECILHFIHDFYIRGLLYCRASQKCPCIHPPYLSKLTVVTWFIRSMALPFSWLLCLLKGTWLFPQFDHMLCQFQRVERVTHLQFILSTSSSTSRQIWTFLPKILHHCCFHP